MGRGGFWPEDDGTEKEFGGWEGREVADKCWGRGEEGGQEPSAGTSERLAEHCGVLAG